MKLKNSTRREFLKFMGRTSVLAYSGALLASCTSTAMKTPPSKLFKALAPQSSDQLVLAPGFNYNILASWGDAINGKDQFGFNCDFITLQTNAQGETFLWVNHESPNPFFVSGFDGSGPRTLAQYTLEAKSVGGSYIRVQEDPKQKGKWKMVPDQRNFRLDGLTKIPFAWPHKIAGGTYALGTLANCAGGQTTWGTLLTCEENYNEFYGEAWLANGKRQITIETSKHGWEKINPQPPERYGWVVEIDPIKKSAKKLIALGRFAHEAACFVISKSGYPVVYMGDDKEDEFIYKFISAEKNSLEKGELFVADSINGKWISLDWNKQKILQKNYASQTEVLIYARQAAKMLGATPQDRPEDVELDPRTGNIFIALTKSRSKDDPYGQIAKLEELDGHEGMSFKLSSYIVGSKKNGVACPDNMAFDPKGNLWFTNDMSGYEIEKGAYQGFGNNALFFVPFEGKNAGQPMRVASGPMDSEFTGPCFSKDGRTLFLSVQHPGELSKTGMITSHWPDGGSSTPKPSVIAIYGEALNNIIG